MYNKKNLSQEFKETMEETKKLVLSSAMQSSVSTFKDEGDIITDVKALRLLNRLCDLCGAMFEKQDKLMDKMDKAMDKYLEENNEEENNEE